LAKSPGCELIADIASADPSNTAVCASCPQACATPGIRDAYSTCLSSGIRNASRSQRIAINGA
jgi:hypothetical protein